MYSEKLFTTFNYIRDNKKVGKQATDTSKTKNMLLSSFENSKSTEECSMTIKHFIYLC